MEQVVCMYNTGHRNMYKEYDINGSKSAWLPRYGSDMAAGCKLNLSELEYMTAVHTG